MKSPLDEFQSTNRQSFRRNFNEEYNNGRESKNDFSENIFRKQKQDIFDMMSRSQVSIKESDEEKDEMKSIKLNNPLTTESFDNEKKVNWIFAPFDTYFKLNEEYPLVKNNFVDSDISKKAEGISLKNLIFKSKEITTLKNGIIEINFDLRISGESSFWIFLRTREEFNKYTAVYKISSEDKKQRVYVSLGTFVYTNEELLYKTFLKQQLINYNKVKTRERSEYANVRGVIIDYGNQKIISKVFLNENTIPNNIEGSFFLPYKSTLNMIIAGKGDGVMINKFKCNQLKTEEVLTIQNDNSARRCECCVLF